MNVLKAVKLVYLVDRESIKRFGFPVLDENRYSMPHGPVNSTTYRYIQGELRQDAGWSDFLTDRSNHRIALANDVGTADDLDELSDADLACVDAVWEQFGGMSQWELVDWTHDPRNVPEWEDPDGGSAIIPMQRILHSVGVEHVDEILETTETLKAIDRAFEAARVN